MRAIYNAFIELNFLVRIFRDPTKAELLRIIKAYSERYFDDEDCFACVVISHGKVGYFSTADNHEIPLEDIFAPFEKNDSLKGKPKLFFIDACRCKINSPSNDSNLVDDLAEDLDHLLPSIQKLICPIVEEPSKKDCLRVYATSTCMLPNATSIRSPFIQRLCELLKSSGKTKSIQTIVATATNAVNGQEVPQTDCTRKLRNVRIVCDCYHTLKGSVFFPDKEI